MSNVNQYWQSVVDTLRDRRLQFRIKWAGDHTMTPWQFWVICPVPGYLETGALGPVPGHEVEWLDVSFFDRDGQDKSESIADLLNLMGGTFTRTDDCIRVTPKLV